MDKQYFINNLWLWKCGIPEESIKDTISLQELKESEWNPEFEQLMRNRLIIGALRYGKINEAGKPQYDRIQSLIKRCQVYQETGNKELLVDIANIALLEFTECNHPKAHFQSLEEHDFHAKKIRN